jgi:hypothetical protein
MEFRGTTQGSSCQLIQVAIRACALKWLVYCCGCGVDTRRDTIQARRGLRQSDSESVVGRPFFTAQPMVLGLTPFISNVKGLDKQIAAKCYGTFPTSRVF